MSQVGKKNDEWNCDKIGLCIDSVIVFEAVHLSPPFARMSYLDGVQLQDAAAETSCEVQV